MPIIRIEGPAKTDLDARRSFIKSVTTAAATYYGMPEEKIIILIKENSPEEVAVGGTLICDR